MARTRRTSSNIAVGSPTNCRQIAVQHFAPLQRRRRAAQLFKEGHTLADVARILKVSRQSVSRWYEGWRRGGLQALKKAPRTGRPPQLTGAQLRRVEQALLKGARANGYSTELWTLRRVAEVIERITASTITRVTSGGSCAGSAGPVRSQLGGRPRATGRPSRPGSGSAGRS